MRYNHTLFPLQGGEGVSFMEHITHGIASELNPSQRKYLENLLAQGAKIAPGKKLEDMTPREKIDFEKMDDVSKKLRKMSNLIIFDSAAAF